MPDNSSPSSPNLFEAYISRRTTQLKTNFQKTNYLARNLHYQLLYGPDHPLGTYARPDDMQRLTLAHVQDFIHRHYSLAHAHLVLSGPIDDELLQLADQYLAPQADAPAPVRIALPVSPQPLVPPAHAPLPDAVQSTIRIGRLLPFPWHSMDYTRFMVLNTVLGGYFGSRLMSNLREDKGYTYQRLHLRHLQPDTDIPRQHHPLHHRRCGRTSHTRRRQRDKLRD